MNFLQKNGVYDVSEKIDEAKTHPDGEKMTIDEIDGNLNTGHIHGEEDAERLMNDEEVGQTFRDSFDNEQIAERFEEIRKANSGRDTKSLIEMTKWSLLADLNPDKNVTEHTEEIDEYLHSHDHKIDY